MTRPPLRGTLATAALALCAGATAVAGVTAGLGVPAVASGAGAGTTAAERTAAVERTALADPVFLDADQLPAGSRFGVWTASRVFDGLPKRPTFCLDGVLPAAGTRYVSYTGKRDVGAQEYITVTGGPAEARALVADLRDEIQGCFRDWLALDIPAYRDGKRSASWKRYSTSDVADGVTTYGVFTVPPKRFDKTTHLYGVGRDGATVLVLHLGVVGARSDAPAKAFARTAQAAALGLS